VLGSDSEVNTKIRLVFIDTVYRIVGDTTVKNKEEKIIELKNTIGQINPANKKIFSAEVDLIFYDSPATNSKFIEAAMSGVMEKLEWYSSWTLDHAAWIFYEHMDDKAKLQRAVQWAKRSIELDNQHYKLEMVLLKDF
jgi:hypothetical protein